MTTTPKSENSLSPSGRRDLKQHQSNYQSNGFDIALKSQNAYKAKNEVTNSVAAGAPFDQNEIRSRLPSSRVQRRQSTPLMPAFMVSAPGKVIVFGEHAVVHGKPAIAAAISLRSYLLVTALSKSRRTVSLRFPDISLEHTWNIDDLPWSTFSHPSKKKYYYDLVTSLDRDLVAAIQPHIKDVSLTQSESNRRIHQASASAFLYLFLSLGSQYSPPCIYTLRSTIPIGAGLGSSASIAVCLSVALLLQIRALSGPHPDQPHSESALQIERVNRWAFVGELCIHGNPSGVDNTVSSCGKAVLFQRKDYSKPPIVTPLHAFPELPLLLVDTCQSRSTSAQLAKVSALKQSQPRLSELLLSTIESVTQEAHDLIRKENFSSSDPEALGRLGELITINHGLLVSLGVSHPKLERIRALIDHVGVGWTKLTGAGGGGCAITVLKSVAAADLKDGSIVNKTQRNIAPLTSRLKNEGFESYETTLAGDGVGVLWPAVLQNGRGEDSEGGEEIDQEKFLTAEGPEEIEALVGVVRTSGHETRQKVPLNGNRSGHINSINTREGWRFWRA